MQLADARELDRAAWAARAGKLRPDGRHVIDGQYVEPASGRWFTDINPATQTPVCEVACGDDADVDAAVQAARRAHADGRWTRLPPRERVAILRRFAELIDAHADAFAVRDVVDMGKPVGEMLAEDLPMSVACFHYFAETIDKIDGQVTNTEADALHYVLRQPLGVVGCITPWNYPMMMAAWKVAPALAAGNTVVLKPAEQSPLSAGLLAELFLEAGGPPGVFNVVHGHGEEAGTALALHDDVAKIGFTGSAAVGKQMLIYAGQSNMKRVTTECGGKSPQIVLSDAPDLDRAAAWAAAGIYANQGEVCNAGSRLLVERSIHDAFVERLRAAAERDYRPGDPLDPATTMGSLVDRGQQASVQGHIDTAMREGARLECGGGPPARPEGGAYIAPTLFTGVEPGMSIAREEVFGPVAAVIPVDGPEHAVEVANDTIYGLAAGVWTRDVGRAHRMARDLEAGNIWVNCFGEGDMTQPWGGWKQSGNGRDKCFQSVLDHTQTKSVWVDIADR